MSEEAPGRTGDDYGDSDELREQRVLRVSQFARVAEILPVSREHGGTLEHGYPAVTIERCGQGARLRQGLRGEVHILQGITEAIVTRGIDTGGIGGTGLHGRDDRI